MRTYSQRMPDDFHLHVRQDAMLRAVLPYTTSQFGRALVMPNLSPQPVLDSDGALDYRHEILRIIPITPFEPLMTIQIVERTTPCIIRRAKKAGVIAGKIYPRGMTTNSENGILDYRSEHLMEILETMEKSEMVLCLHGESPDPKVEVLQREEAFLKDLEFIAERFLKLRIVLEHITTEAAALKVVELSDNVAATITLHHLLITLNDVIGGKLKPHLFCKPVAKLRSDRKTLFGAAFSGSPKFFFGSDSAPHAKRTKECAEGCAGIFTAPVIMPMLADIFYRNGRLNLLENFTATFGAEFYGLPLNQGRLDLVEEPYEGPKEIPVPELNDSVVVFNGGKTIPWKLV